MNCCFHGNNGYANASQCHIIRTLPILFSFQDKQTEYTHRNNCAHMFRTFRCKDANNYLCSFFCGAAAQLGPSPPHSRGFQITHNDAPQSIGLLWTSDQLVAETSTSQHSQQTDIYAPCGIRTHNLSGRAAAELRLRPRGHWDRRATYIV